MQKFLKIIDRTADWGGVGSSICLLLIVTMILVEILVRTLSGQSTFITEEYSGYLLSWFAFLGMSYTLKSDGHIRVTMLLSRVSLRKKAFLEIVAGVIGMAAFGYLTFNLIVIMSESIKTGVRSMHVSETPLFIPQILPVLGSFLVTIEFLPYLAGRWHDFSACRTKEKGVSNG